MRSDALYKISLLFSGKTLKEYDGMFKIHESARLPIPPGLFDPGEEAAVFSYAECVGNQPVWLIHLGMHAEDGSEAVWQKRVFVGSLKEACAILSFDFWVTRRLYVILPEYMTRKTQLRLEDCITVYECKEPHSDETCWRIETDSGTVLDSNVGTQLGNEVDVCLLWRRGDTL